MDSILKASFDRIELAVVDLNKNCEELSAILDRIDPEELRRLLGISPDLPSSQTE